MSGAKSNRPGLETAIDFVRSGDTLVVWRLDRLGRNMRRFDFNRQSFACTD